MPHDLSCSPQVLFGGGEQTFRAEVNQSTACRRGDGKDLVWDWNQFQKKEGRRHRYVDNKEGLLQLNASTDYVLGT